MKNQRTGKRAEHQNGDEHAFLMFAICERPKVGMPKQQSDLGYYELHSCSKASILLTKLLRDLKISFNRFAEGRDAALPTLVLLAEWLVELQALHGVTVSFIVSPAAELKRRKKIQHAFTAKQLELAKHTHPVNRLQQKYWLLAGLPLFSIVQCLPVSGGFVANLANLVRGSSRMSQYTVDKSVGHGKVLLKLPCGDAMLVDLT